jgi:threonine/homoserine/homoserine lactone efflux protein
MPLIMDFGKGVLLGLSVAAPVGPIGLLCIRRSLVDGPAAGFATGMGAAFADLAYAAAAAAGLAAVATQWPWLQPAGTIFLLWLGIQTWRAAKPAASLPSSESATLLGAFGGTFVLTLLNPMTILSFTAMLAALGAADPRMLVPGVFLGSALWWLFLSAAAARFRTNLTGPRSVWLNRAAASMLIALALRGLA